MSLLVSVTSTLHWFWRVYVWMDSVQPCWHALFDNICILTEPPLSISIWLPAAPATEELEGRAEKNTYKLLSPDTQTQTHACACTSRVSPCQVDHCGVAGGASGAQQPNVSSSVNGWLKEENTLKNHTSAQPLGSVWGQTDWHSPKPCYSPHSPSTPTPKHPHKQISHLWFCS